VPGIVIADTEPFANNLQSIAHKNLPYTTINSSEDLQRLLFVLRDDTLRANAAEQLGIEKIEAVAIDTVDTLQQILKTERLKETRQTQFLRDDWAWLKDQMENIIRAFTALPLHVFFIVHTKTQEVGKGGDDSRTVVLPSLQGSIAESIAGMVGYSLLSFRKQEIRPDGSPYTKYWLRAEGDETYGFLGNRAAGRLPDVIEPSFQSILDAALAGRAAIKTPVQPVDPELHVTTEAPATESVEEVAQNPSQPGAPAPVVDGNKPADDEPVNSAALVHVKKIYDACGLGFPEEIIRGLTLGEARQLVRLWQAVQADHAEGKAEEGTTAIGEMVDWLKAADWVLPEAEAPAEKVIVADANGTIEQILAYVGDDLVKVQEVYDRESAKDKPRATLINALSNKGAKDAPAVQADVETDAAADEVPVTPDDTTADPTKAEEELLVEALDARVVDILDGDGEQALCEECNGPIDDQDIAVLSRSRFKRWLCVSDYIAETKKPHQG
jgi:hypothetical protein